MRVTRLSICVTLSFLGTCCSAQHIEWYRQFSGGPVDWANAVSADGMGNLYLVGTTDGLLGEQHFGYHDMFIAKYDSSGSQQWLVQSGTRDPANPGVPLHVYDESHDVIADRSGRVYFSIEGSGSSGRIVALNDCEVSGNCDGCELTETCEEGWTTLWQSPRDGKAIGVTADTSGNSFLSGSISWVDFFGGHTSASAAMFNSTGAEQWESVVPDDLEEWPGEDSLETALAIDLDGTGNIYIAGSSAAGGIDASSAGFVTKFDPSGNLLWTKLLDTPAHEVAEGIAVYEDQNNDVHLYVVGVTAGDLHGVTNSGGNGDAFLSKYDADGELVWTKFFGDGSYDRAWDVDVDENGHIYIAGEIDGSGGSRVDGDAFVAKFDESGNLLWDRAFGDFLSGGFFADVAYGLSVATDGVVYATGITGGEPGPTTNIWDAYLIKIVEELSADYNGDGVVNGGDFLIWQRQLGMTDLIPYEGADGDGDGNVTVKDLAIWQQDYGMSIDQTSAPTSASTLPEPNSFMLTIVGTLLICRRLRYLQWK